MLSLEQWQEGQRRLLLTPLSPSPPSPPPPPPSPLPFPAWRNVESCGTHTAGDAAGAEEGHGSWKPHVPRAALRRAIAHEGDMLRFDRLIHKVGCSHRRQ